jgi:hypothetical protein
MYSMAYAPNVGAMAAIHLRRRLHGYTDGDNMNDAIKIAAVIVCVMVLLVALFLALVLAV